MVNLRLEGPEPCEHCDARADGLTVLAITDAQRALLQDVLEQIDTGAKADPQIVAMSAAERDDLHALLSQVVK